jgi:hypothetical protein
LPLSTEFHDACEKVYWDVEKNLKGKNVIIPTPLLLAFGSVLTGCKGGA